MQSFFGQAIRQNNGDPDKIAVATQAIPSNYSESRNHEFCSNEKTLGAPLKEKSNWQK